MTWIHKKVKSKVMPVHSTKSYRETVGVEFDSNSTSALNEGASSIDKQQFLQN